MCISLSFVLLDIKVSGDSDKRSPEQRMLLILSRPLLFHVDSCEITDQKTWEWLKEGWHLSARERCYVEEAKPFAICDKMQEKTVKPRVRRVDK